MSDPVFELPSGAPFAHEQQVALKALLPTLQPAQAAWLSGYFGAMAQLRGAPGASVAAAPAPVAAATPAVPLTILFGSESGNAEGCAQKLEAAAKAEGFKTTLADMADYSPAKLAQAENVLVVVSTWGEGEPPERAADFHAAVMGEGAPRLEKLRFAVCGLGDTGYADFCQCGKDFDRRLAELGAQRVHDRVDCDVDFDEPFGRWMKGALGALVTATGVKEKVAAPTPSVAVAAAVAMDPLGFGAPAAEAWGKQNPYPARIKDLVCLNGPGSKKQTMHVEIDLGDSGMSYEPGDVLCVFPSNCPEVVDDFVRLAGFRGDEIREAEGRYLSLVEALASHDVTSLSKSFMTKYAPFAKSPALEALLASDTLKDWLWGRELRDLFLEFPPAEPLSLDQLVALLRKQPPRLYSIASSLRAHPGEVHLTVGAVRYSAHGRERKGVCSTFFSDRVQPGDTVPVYLHHNKNFKLPADPATPIVMVGPGTGIAPFRAFVEERVETGAPGKSWLFFGDWTFQEDFLYQAEWQKYLKSGGLTRMDVAFSRDTEQKVYVQHRMREKSKELYAWLEEGAHFYVCGDASRMAKDVHQALIDLVAEHGGKSPEAAEAYVKELQKAKRYQRDVY